MDRAKSHSGGHGDGAPRAISIFGPRTHSTEFSQCLICLEPAILRGNNTQIEEVIVREIIIKKFLILHIIRTGNVDDGN